MKIHHKIPQEKKKFVNYLSTIRNLYHYVMQSVNLKGLIHYTSNNILIGVGDIVTSRNTHQNFLIMQLKYNYPIHCKYNAYSYSIIAISVIV